MKISLQLKYFLPLLLFCASAFAQKQPCTAAGETIPFLGIQTIRLWPGDAPEAKGKACEDTPTLTVFYPRAGVANGSSVVILPGGSHMRLAGDLEGREIADWFTARGITAFILQYRLGSNGYIFPVPLYDARRAVQLVRSRAADYHLDPNRVVMIGFSAGGHLAALAATKPVAGNADANDPIDRVPSRPDYLVLGYPWIGAISLDYSHLNYCKLMKVEDRCAELAKEFSPDLFVTKDTPPTFWYHTADDTTVPIEQGLRFYEALLKAGVPVEAHVFAHGAHGSGLGKGNPSLDQWPQLLETWLRAQGVIPQAVH
ncbi:MAG TPA: alpha/beta hydrolase [Terracidiphilus sp.]|jgi:acetyl esterase/lipase